MRSAPPIPDALCQRIAEVSQRLTARYGRPQLEPSGDPIEELVGTVLSQHTTDSGSERAYADLVGRYPTWEEVANAPLDDVALTIRASGLSMQKARTIQAALATVDAESLTALSALPVPEARARLTAIRGVGDKTASCVLLFALGMPAQPVDTHIERVSKRLGIVNGESTATGIQHVYEHCLPPSGEAMFAFHRTMIRHGREVCQARDPKCGICPLTDLCAYYARHVRSN